MSESISLETVFAQLPEYIYWLDRNNKILGCNDLWAKKIGGCSRTEIIGKSIEEFYVSNDASKHCEIHETVIKKDIKQEVKEVFMDKNGEQFIFSAKKMPLYDGERKRVAGVLVVGTELEDDPMGFLKQIVEDIPVNIYWKNKEGVYIGCNERVAKDSGFDSPQEIIGKTDYDFISKESAEMVYYTDKEVMESGQEKCLEECVEVLARNREEAVVLSNKTPFKNSKGEIVGILGVSINITKYKKLEAQLRKDKQCVEERERLRIKNLAKMHKTVTGQEVVQQKSVEEHVQNMLYYFENIIAYMPGYVYWKDREGVFLGCNNNVASLVGLESRHDLIGKMYHELPRKKGLSILDRNDLAVMEKDSMKQVEESGRLHDGSIGTYLSTKVPLHDQPGNVIGILGISTDITERKKLEKKLREAKVREKLQRERVQSMQAVAASIAHELRTPLCTIIGGTSGAKDFLPELIDTYKIAKTSDLKIPVIQSRHIDLLVDTVANIEREARFANNVIDMLLIKIN